MTYLKIGATLSALTLAAMNAPAFASVDYGSPSFDKVANTATFEQSLMTHAADDAIIYGATDAGEVEPRHMNAATVTDGPARFTLASYDVNDDALTLAANARKAGYHSLTLDAIDVDDTGGRRHEASADNDAPWAKFDLMTATHGAPVNPALAENDVSDGAVIGGKIVHLRTVEDGEIGRLATFNTMTRQTGFQTRMAA